MITSIFRKLSKVSTNNFKTDINGISDPLEMCKKLSFLHKSLFINQLEILSRVHRKCITQVLPLHNNLLTIEIQQDLRTGGLWFDSRLGQWLFPRIDDSHCDRIDSFPSFVSFVPRRLTWDSSQWHGKNIMRGTGKIKALKTLVWHLSMESMKEMSSLKKVIIIKKKMYDELVRTNKAKD